MPSYKLPALKKPKKHNSDVVESMEDDYPGKWDRELRIPINEEILKGLKVGDKVEVTVMAEISELASNESVEGKKKNRKSMTILMSGVDVYPANDVKKAEAEMASGYKKAGGRSR